ncbi:MAG TPA: hypothetical protein VE715_16620, partial [Blastocatellia bacterium]|nr:hypothetical protein [Blastocatellia bacterium]
MAVDNRLKSSKRPPRKLGGCIAYLCAQRNRLYISKKYRSEILKKWKVERDSDNGWFIPRRQLSVSLHEVDGFVGSQLMDEREGDGRIRKGCKCTGNHAAREKT